MADLNERCPVGIPGFDEFIGGGLPRGRSIIVSGSCGTGKTTLAVQYLHAGATQFNEPGVLVTLEQASEEIRSDMLRFGFDLQKLEDEGKLIIIDTSLSKIGLKDFISTLPVTPKKSFSLLPGEFDLENVVKLTLQAAQKIGAKRLVIDSLPALDVFVGDNIDIRKTLVNMTYELKANDLTTLFITETSEDGPISRYGVEEYVADGVIVLKANEALDTRTLQVRKMRTTAHSLKPRVLNFGSNGIEIKKAAKTGVI